MDKNEEIKNKKIELLKKLKETKEELECLRKKCKHSEYKIKDTNFGQGTLELRKVCSFCDKKIGYPTSQDLKDNGYSS